MLFRLQLEVHTSCPHSLHRSAHNLRFAVPLFLTLPPKCFAVVCGAHMIAPDYRNPLVFPIPNIPVGGHKSIALALVDKINKQEHGQVRGFCGHVHMV